MNLPFIVGSIFTVFSLWILKHAITNFRTARQSESWPSVTGRLVTVELWGTRNVDGVMKPVERLSIQYDYQVDGHIHTGKNVAFYTLVYPETVQFAENHPENSDVRVYYSPETPSNSVFIPGVKGDNKRYSEIILASMALTVGIAITTTGAYGWIG